MVNKDRMRRPLAAGGGGIGAPGPASVVNPTPGAAGLDPRFSFRTSLGISQKTLDILSESLRISQGFFKKAPESLNIEFLVV